MRKNLTIWFFLLVFALPFSAFSIYVIAREAKPLPEYGTVSKGFRMKTQGGDTYTNTDWEDKIVVVDFFFTSCATICPDMTENLLKVQKAFAEDENVIISSFSVDPENDSASVLADYALRYNVQGEQWQFLTGNKQEIYLLARTQFKVVATEGDGGSGDFIHTEKFVLLDQKKKIRGYYDGTSNQEVKQLIRDIKKLQYEN